MWYISFHGGDPGVNNIQVYHNSGKPHTHPNLLPTDDSSIPPLCELRAFEIVGDLLYVVNGYKKYSQVLTYRSDGSGGYNFNEVVASSNGSEAIFHPYDITFDPIGNLYVSNQDSNVVAGFKAVNVAMDVAPALLGFHQPGTKFLAGTRVASSIGKLPHLHLPVPPNVPTPQGLDVNYTDDTDTKIAHSVRGILYYKGFLFVCDEPASSVKIYQLESGRLYGKIIGPNLSAPVQLLEKNGILYIGSSGNASVVTYDLSAKVPMGNVAPTTFIDGQVKHVSGMAFGPEGNFYAAERKAKKIKMFSADGSNEQTFIKDLPDNPEFILNVPKG